jgi:hypothetical protein
VCIKNTPRCGLSLATQIDLGFIERAAMDNFLFARHSTAIGKKWELLLNGTPTVSDMAIR